jgi:thiosulfate/3-mercaptopyruvate sulfurtransferase
VGRVLLRDRLASQRDTWFYAYLQGWQRIAVYDGGWFEWSQDPIDNPIEVGLPVDEVAS